MQVTREILIDADLVEVWHALTDDTTIADWLDEPAARVVLDAEPGHSLTWAWWPDDEHELSTVTFTLAESDDGLTRVTVTEARVGASRSCTVEACGSIDGDLDRWSQRLVGLDWRCSRATRLIAV